MPAGVSYPSCKACFCASSCPFDAAASERDVAVCSARRLHTQPAGRLAAVVLSGAGGGGSTTQELSRNQNSRLAASSASRSLSVILIRTFPPGVFPRSAWLRGTR